MSEFKVVIDKFPDPDKTLREVLTTLRFQNDNENLLVRYQVRDKKVFLTFETG